MRNSKNKILAAAICGVITGSVGTSIVGNFQANEQSINTLNSANSNDNNSNNVIEDSEEDNKDKVTSNDSYSENMPSVNENYFSNKSERKPGGPGGDRGGHHRGEAELDSVETIDIANGEYADGTYTGSASGFSSGLKVQVVISNGKISDIQVVSHNETPGFYERAIETVPEEIISNQTTDVDTVSGATYTSVGIINAVNDALSNAKS